MEAKLTLLVLSGKELRLILITLISLIIIPILTVVILTQAGISLVSNTLASFNPINSEVRLNYPNGTLYKIWDQSVTWPVSGVVTLDFGQSDLPFQPFHTGIDIANPEGKIGDPVVAFADGTVKAAGSVLLGCGNGIILDHPDSISSMYCHLNEVDVHKGENVKLGQMIGKEGQTGWATGPHLHFQISYLDIPINPRTFFESINP